MMLEHFRTCWTSYVASISGSGYSLLMTHDFILPVAVGVTIWAITHTISLIVRKLWNWKL